MLPSVKREVPAVQPDQPWHLAHPGMVLGLKVVLALPFFAAGAIVLLHPEMRLALALTVGLVLIALGCTLVLTRSFAVAASVFLLGGAALACGIVVALLSGMFGGHQ